MTEYLGKQIGNYHLIRALGNGGFADVYLGEHIYLHTQAAIKILQTRLVQNNLTAFLTEARTIASLTHPNIIQVFDFGEAENTPFLVMAYAPNGTLRQRHPGGTRLSLAEVVIYTGQIAEALQYAHERKLIHRDVKPENMLVGQDGKILLSDFGIAVVSQSSRYQGKQEVGGTVAYMAPEQLQGKANAASDQYALGVIVYEWLAGEKPFNGSFAEIASQHLFTPPPSLRTKVPEISPAVEQVLAIVLNKDPQQRFLNVKAFASALAQCQADSAMLTGSTLFDERNAPTVVKPQSIPEYAPAQLAMPNIFPLPAIAPGSGPVQPAALNNLAQAATPSALPVMSTPTPTPMGIQQGLNTPTPGILAPNAPEQSPREQPRKARSHWGLVAIIVTLLILFVAASSVGATYYFIHQNNNSQAGNSSTGNAGQPTVSATQASANTPVTNQNTPTATNASITPSSSNPGGTTINENLHLTCIDGCTLQVSVILDTIVINSSSSSTELHFTIKNESTSLCSGMHAYPLYLEDPAGKQTQGDAPGTFTESNDLNAGQTFQEYSTFQLAPVHNTSYTLHASLECNYYSESFQIETFTF